jgi:hypothetical protein
MKIGTKHAVAAAIGITLFLGAGLLLAQQTKALHKAVTLQGVQFSKLPQGVQMERPAELANIPPAPPPLPAGARQATYNQIRAAAGLVQVTTTAVVPAQVTLTPEAPKSGRNSYAVYDGHNYPDPGQWKFYPAQTLPFAYTRNGLYFIFDTIPGKTYMVDLTVTPQKEYYLQGAFTGKVTPQNGHILVGFTANARESQLRVGSYFYFYRCEITLVN